MSLLFDWTFSSMYIIKLSTYKHFNLNIQKINNLTNLRTYCPLLNVFSYRFVNQWESNTIEHQGEQSRYQSINRSIQLYTIEVKCEFKMRRRLLLQSDTTFYRRLCSTGDRIDLSDLDWFSLLFHSRNFVNYLEWNLCLVFSIAFRKDFLKHWKIISKFI